MTKQSLPFICGFFLSVASAQDASPLQMPTTLDQKAARYYELLQKKPENAPVLQRFIDAWLENGDQKQLLTILRDKAKSGSANEWRILAAASEYLGDDASALTALNEALKIIPEDAATRIARATLTAKMQNFNVAIADLELAMKNEALLLPAATLRGKLLAQTGRVEEAVKTWNDLIAKFPADIGLQEDLLDLLIQENLLDQALASSKQLIEKTKDPYQKAMRRLRTAEILSLSGKKAEASEEYLAILELSAQDSWLERETIALAEKLHSAEDDPTAWKKFLDSAITAAPTRNALQQQLAAYFQLAGQQNEAQKIHESLVAKNPGSRPMRECLIAFLLQTQQGAKAIEHIRHLLKTNPNDAPLWEQLATLHRDLKQTDEMNQALAKAAELLPADEAGSIQSAQLYQRFEQEKTTEEKLRETAKKFGPSSDAADTLAQFLFSKGKNDEAMEIWKQAALAADREGLLRLARTLTAIGKHQQSADFILSRLKDFPDDALLLSTLCQSAPLLENPQALLPQAMQLVRLAISATDLENAINIASAIISRSDSTAKTIEELVALPQPTMGESCLLAQLYEILGDSINANRILDAAANRDKTLSVPLRRISLLTLRGDLDGAIAAWRKLIALPGGNKPQHWKELAALIRRNGDLNEAVAAVQQWKSVAPGDKATYQTLAEIYQELGDPEKAVAEIRRMIAKFGADAENRGKLIDVLNETGLHAEALRLALLLYDEAESASEKLKQCPRIATAAQADGREKEIDEMFQKRARENTTSTTALIALQEMRQAWQISSYRYSDERQDFTPLVEAMRRKPNDKELILDVADRYQASGMTEKSEPLYRKVEQMNPTGDELRRIAGFYRAIGEVERAEEITKNLKNAPQNIQDSENAVLSQIMVGNPAEALVLLDPLQKAHPLDWRLNYLRGIALLRQKQFSESANVFLQVSNVQDELKRIAPLKNTPSHYNHYYQAMHSNTSRMSVEEVFGYCYEFSIGFMQSLDTLAKQSSSRGYYGNAYGMHRMGMYGMGGGETLPQNAQQARYCAIHFLLYIAANAPENEALALLPKINAPSLPFLSAIKTEIELSDPVKFVNLAIEKKTDISLLKMAISGSFGRYEQATLDERHSRRYRRSEQEPEIVNEETAKKLRSLLAEISPEDALEYAGYYASQTDIENIKEKEMEDLRFILSLLPKCKAEVRKKWIVLLTTIKAKLPQSPALAALVPQLDSILQTLQSENPDLAKKNSSYRLFLLNQAITSGEFSKASELMSLHLDSLYLPTQVDDDSPYTYYARQSSQSISALRNTESLPGASPLNIQNDEFTSFMQTEGGMPHEKLLFEKFGYEDLMRYTMYGGCQFLRAYVDQSEQARPTLAPELEALVQDLKISDQPDTEEIPKRLSFKPEQGEAIVKALATCKFPIFRCVILRELGYKVEYQKALDGIMAADSTAGAESLLWAATQLAEQKGDPKKIYQLCLRAREKNLPRVHNDLADAMLMAAALALPKEQKSTLDLAAVQSSALRLTKKIPLNQGDDQAKDYAKVLASLGLNDAGKRLAQKSASQRNRNSSSPYQQVQSAQAKIAKLIASNQKEAAARLVYQLKTTTNSSGYNLEDEFTEILTGAKLQKEYITIATPPATASYTRRKNACLQIIKLLGIDSQKETLEKLYAENPEDLEVLLSFISIKSEAEASALIKKIVQKPEFKIEQFTQNFAQQLNRFIQGGSTTVDTYKVALGNYRLMASLLKALPKGTEIDKASHAFFSAAIFKLLQRSYISGAYDNMPAWGSSLSSSRSTNDKKVIIDLIKEREIVMEQLTLAYLNHPIFFSNALAIIQQATPEWRGKFRNTDQPIVQALITQGMEVFKSKSDDSSDEEEDDYDPFSRSNYSSSDDVVVDPQNVALDLALSLGAGSVTVAAAVEAALPEEIMAKHQAICQMLRQPNADAIAAFLNEDPKKNAACLQFSLKMLQLRGEDIYPCLTALLQHKDFVEVKVKEQPAVQVGEQTWPFYELLANVLRYAMSPKQSARHEEFLKTYTTTLLGAEKHWAAYAKIPDSYRDNTISILSYRKNMLGTSLQPYTTSKDPAKLPCAVATLRFLWKNNLVSNNSSSQEMEFPATGDAKKDRETILSLVANLKAAGLFRMGSGMLQKNQRSVEFLPSHFLPDLSENAANTSSWRKIFFEELIKLTGDDALYAGLTALAYGGKFEQDVQPRLVAHLAQIKKWSEAEQKNLVLWLNQNNYKPKDPALLTWMKNAGSGTFSELEKELRTLAASSSDYNVWDEDDVAQLLRNMISMDADKTGQIWGEILNHDIANPLPKNLGRSYNMNSVHLSPIQYAHLELLRTYSENYGSPTLDENYLFSDFLSTLPKINWSDAHAKFFGTYSLPAIFGISLTPEERIAIHPQMKIDAVLTMMLFHKRIDEAKLLKFPDILRGYFYHQSFAVHHREIPTMEKWYADQFKDQNTLSAKIGKLSLLLFQRSSPDAKVRADKALEFDQVFTQLMQDPRITPVAKCCLYSKQYSNLTPKYDFTSISPNLLESLQNDTKNPSRVFYEVIDGLVKRPHPVANMQAICEMLTNEFQTIAESFDEGENAAYFMKSSLVPIALATKHKGLLDAILGHEQANMNGDIELIAKLISHDFIDLALRIVPKPNAPSVIPQYMMMQYPDYKTRTAFYSSFLEKQLPKFLSMIPDPGQRFRMECLLSLLHDADKAKPSENWDARITRLAKSFAKNAPTEKQSRKELLAILGVTGAAENRDEYMRVIGVNTIGENMANWHALRQAGQSTASVLPQNSIIYAIMHADLNQGDLDLVFKNLSSLMHYAKNSSEERLCMEAYQTVIKSFTLSIPLSMLGMPAEKQEKVLQELIKHAQVASTKPFYNTADGHRLRLMLLWAHAVSGKGADFVNNYATLDQGFQAKYPALANSEFNKNNWRQYCYYELRWLRVNTAELMKLNKERLADLFKVVLQSKEICEAEIFIPGDLNFYIDAKFLTWDQLTGLISALPDDYSNKPLFLCQMACHKLIKEKQSPASDELYDKSVKLAQSQNNPLTNEIIAMYGVELHYRNRNKEQGLKIVEGIDVTTIRDRQKHLKNTINQMKKPVKK